jgi:hypothetical protein
VHTQYCYCTELSAHVHIQFSIHTHTRTHTHITNLAHRVSRSMQVEWPHLLLLHHVHDALDVALCV